MDGFRRKIKKSKSHESPAFAGSQAGAWEPLYYNLLLDRFPRSQSFNITAYCGFRYESRAVCTRRDEEPVSMALVPSASAPPGVFHERNPL